METTWTEQKARTHDTQWVTEVDGFTLRASWGYDKYPDFSWCDDETMAKTKRGDLFQIVVVVKAYRAGIELGASYLGGVCCEDCVDEKDVLDAISEYGLDREAVKEAQEAIKKLCGCH